MSGWEIRFSNSKKLPYYYNATTNESVWEKPAEVRDEHALPGAHYLSGSQAPAPNQVRASHILYKHAGSRRPSSWKQDKITRTADEAREAIQGHITHLKSLPADQVAPEFARIASTESDCSSARKGGDLGWFGRGMMQKAFEDGTYALQVGELSPIIETDSGIHVILRTG